MFIRIEKFARQILGDVLDLIRPYLVHADLSGLLFYTVLFEIQVLLRKAKTEPIARCSVVTDH